MLIRLVHHDELEAVGRLTAAAYTSDYPDLPADYLASLIDVAGRAARDEVWVAERRSDRALVGTVWTPREGQTISAVARPGELDFRLLATAPDARGLGVGAALTRHVLQLGRERGVSQVVMNSGPEMLGAHALYAKLGFARLSEREGPIEVAPGRFIEIYAFGYPLGAASSISAA
ncbi:GNAT family N-acetyltransferase [Schumannella soli]|uniref:GNAT family N-acetyltransferase n=1 Tax=Schumannella soli TaxID=2590779 RepID=A0A506Y872_9MICO|nr:GNAT family N-acetyltransferase [Schumannella soli]